MSKKLLKTAMLGALAVILVLFMVNGVAEHMIYPSSTELCHPCMPVHSIMYSYGISLSFAYCSA